MTASSVPKIQFTESGLVLPTESAILAGVQADMDVAFGGGLNANLETPQGQLASSQTAIIGDKNDEFAYFVNQIDPTYAENRFQDAIARIYFLTRKPALPTSVVCTLTGIVGTLVPAGTLAQDTSGNTYILVSDATISSLGTVSATFENIQTGPIACAANTLNKVYQTIIGWDAINNPDAGVIGSDVESQSDFEYRRKNSVTINANGTNGAIYAAVFNVENVIDVYVTDNPTGSTVDTGATDYPIIAHSVYVAVVGGSDEDIARAIWTKKDLGCDYNGNTTVTVTDESGYNYPYPSYEVTFNRPSSLPIQFAIEIVDDPNLPSNIITLIKNAVIAKFNGTDGTGRERIGSSIFASKYYGPISLVANNLAIISILIGSVTPTLSIVNVGIDETPTISESDISVTLV